jgi:phospholipase C
VTAADENLRKIDHIVVLMMENRSFDHMLGFLTIEQGREDIEGPTLEMKNEYRGETFHVRPAARTTMNKAQDPCHSGWCVDEQVANDCGGYVSNFMKSRQAGGANPGVVMAYHPAEHLPVYDFLAKEFCVCDHWFCSVPGATMPNRCYALGGTSHGLRNNIKPSRPYNVPSFVRHLKPDQWRWYSHDYVPTIWLIDPEIGLSLENVPAYFDRRDVFGHRSFIERARKGDLPAVSWIDPNFYDLTFGPAGSNDDHPPSDLRAGQKLVLQLVDALFQSPAWRKTLLVITYDEHGGFFDHVQPPKAADNLPTMRQYGPRVPALVVSPYIARGSVSKTVYDHTSIIKTILTRFCRKANGSIPNMGKRVAAANHLGELLTRSTARRIKRSDYQPLVDASARWHEEMVLDGVPAPGEGLAIPHELTDFQKDFLGAKADLLAARRQLDAAGKAVF